MSGLNIELTFDRETKKFLDGLGDDLRDGLEEGVRDTAHIIEASAKKGMGKRGRPKVRTGHLRRSIRSGVRKTVQFIAAWVGSDLVYARPLEEGSVQHIKGYRRVKIRGVGWRTLKGIIRMKPYPWLRPAFEDEARKVSKHILNTILKRMKK